MRLDLQNEEEFWGGDEAEGRSKSGRVSQWVCQQQRQKKKRLKTIELPASVNVQDLNSWLVSPCGRQPQISLHSDQGWMAHIGHFLQHIQRRVNGAKTNLSTCWLFLAGHELDLSLFPAIPETCQTGRRLPKV